MSKILICGDLHFRPELRYADYVKDRRIGETKAVLDKIVEASSDCDKVVLLGDCFDQKSNPNQVIRAFTEFVERFGDKELFIISGNHEKLASGETALDYLKEIKNKNWHIFTKGVTKWGDYVFVPYFFKQEMELDSYQEATERLLTMLPPAKFMFCHHAISDSLTNSGEATNLFPEIVLPRKELEARYSKIFGGHIHKAQSVGEQILIAGSVFTNEVGEDEKYVFKLNEETGEITWIPLPVRPIVLLKNPSLGTIQSETDTYAIVKTIFTEKQETPIEEYRKELAKFDASIIIEQYASERKKVLDIQSEIGGNVDFSIPKLLEIYSTQKKVSKEKLMSAFEEVQSL